LPTGRFEGDGFRQDDVARERLRAGGRDVGPECDDGADFNAESSSWSRKAAAASALSDAVS
jgi:hypothetical protein